MKLNRKWLMVIALVMSMAMATGGTLAFLTDRDTEVNVFTIGNVDIDLKEDFEQDSELIPGVDIEKKPTITNMGPNDAWVWATIAIPSALDNDDASANVVHFNYSKESVEAGKWTWQKDGAWMVEKNVDHDDVAYNVYTVLYQTALKKGDTTEPVIYKVYMDDHVDIAPDGQLHHVEKGVVTDLNWNINTNGNPKIYVSAYAMQTNEFENVYDAYEAYTNQWTATGDAKEAIEWGEDDGVTDSDIPEVVPADATYVQTFAQLKDAVAKGGNVALLNDIVFEEPIIMEKGENVVLYMNGKTITPASAKADPFFDTYPGTSLVITGNGTFDLKNNPGMSVLMPGGNVTIKNGTFLKDRSDNVNGPLIAAYARAEGQFIIEGGYFDSGYYREGDCFNNCRNGVNLTSGNTYRIYGGTFVGQNPAWGDEGRAVLCPHCNNDGSNCQGVFLEGQTRTSTELPEGYTITEGVTEDGRPTYTVNYSK